MLWFRQYLNEQKLFIILFRVQMFIELFSSSAAAKKILHTSLNTDSERNNAHKNIGISLKEKQYFMLLNYGKTFNGLMIFITSFMIFYNVLI